MACGCLLPDAVLGEGFEFWRDGKAELDGYRYTVSRYGESRVGQAVMVFVTEPFSRSKNVKVDDHTRDPADTFEALKLNLVRDFQTGIYDYNTMVSVFTRSDDFSPVKITFSSAEWCGHVYEELIFGAREIDDRLFSYFEDESRTSSLDRKQNGVAEENLFILLRGLRGDFLEAGEKRSVPFLPGTFNRRLTHQPIGWSEAELERLPGPERVQVPAGTFSTMVYLVRTAGGRQGRFNIEEEYPHRIVRWSWSPASKSGGGGWTGGTDSGELTGSVRLSYWALHDNGHESYLDELGLEPIVD
jgi:hypothetical protein